MAAYAAHLTRTAAGAPSVFTLVAQDALGQTVKPALRRLLEYLAETYPGAWSRACVAWYDELYLLFDLCLQHHYLKHYAASFSESFYGLARVPTAPSREFSSGLRLPAAAERASLALLVAAPYLRDKAEAASERWRDDIEQGRLASGSASDRVRRAAVRVHAVAHLACAAAQLAQLGAHLAGRAAPHAPSLALLRLALRTAPPQPPPQHSWRHLLRALRAGQLRAAAASLPLLGALLLRGAQYGAFGVQFLRWWESSAAPRAALPPPPPPQRDERSLRWKNKCPLCLQRWRAPAALPVSGYVFCYACVARHVRLRGACPATRLPAAERDLVRLYLP